MTEKVVKVTNNGMISIPAEIRKKHKIKDGDFVLVKEDENGEIIINPIESVESLRKKGLTIDEFRKIYKKSRDEDRELER
ncbi:MAG: AbrB/MazE/SpoVT family DNA-binding domain-containing protein [Candidatus Helarchaeota archaeon]